MSRTNPNALCTQSPLNGEFTLCGDAFDLCAVDDSEATAPIFAAPGDVIDCELCRAIIDRCKSIRNYREPDHEP